MSDKATANKKQVLTVKWIQTLQSPCFLRLRWSGRWSACLHTICSASKFQLAIRVIVALLVTVRFIPVGQHPMIPNEDPPSLTKSVKRKVAAMGHVTQHV